MAKQVIPSIHIPIQEKDGSISWVWYMFLKYLSSVEGGSGASSLSQLSDVNISSPTNNQYLVYDNGIWKNQTLSISWGQIGGDIEDQTDLKNALDSKQDVLTAGTNITIDENNVISATGDSLPDQTGNAGKFLTTNGTDASWGTTLTETLYLTGDNTQNKIVFNDGNNDSQKTTLRASWNSLVFEHGNDGLFTQAFAFSWLWKAIYPVGWRSSDVVTLGISNYKWSNVYTNKLNNGADIEVPNQAGTMVVANPTGATQGQVLTLDSNLKPAWADASSGSTRYNVGDIFFTMRNDNGLNGAVECNGATYDTTDFTGAQSIGQLLAGGKVPYVSLSQYATLLSTQGSCGVFGWDGGSTTEFRIPSLNDIFVETGTAAQIGDYLEPALPDHKHFVSYSRSPFNGGQWNSDIVINYSSSGVETSAASVDNPIYKEGATVQPNAVRYRAMVQLAVGATDEALETCTNVLAMLANADFVIERQDPTAANNYTWYRKYKSGWVEMGGSYGGSQNQVISLPLEMADNNYSVMLSFSTTSGYTPVYSSYAYNNKTTTSFQVINSGSINGMWEVSGMSAS